MSRLLSELVKWIVLRDELVEWIVLREVMTSTLYPICTIRYVSIKKKNPMIIKFCHSEVKDQLRTCLCESFWGLLIILLFSM